MIEIALYQPDIAQNLGTTIRTAACFDCNLHIIEPCGFPFDAKKFKRSAMDYIDYVNITRHLSWENFIEYCVSNNKIPVLTTTKSNINYLDFKFSPHNIIIAGRETAGVPETVSNYCRNQVVIKMNNKTRSLNVAISTAIILAEATRQIKLNF